VAVHSERLREGCAPGGPGPRRPVRGYTGIERARAAARGPGAVGHGGIVPYRARSPARSAAEGHAHNRFSQLKLDCGRNRAGNG